jgi:hypothetical protein
MVEFGFGSPLLASLVVIAFLSGIGITTVGPGGIFVTISLYSLTAIPAATIAGTAHATFVGTGLVASVAYVRSGELKTGTTRALTILLSLTSLLGALVGAYLNAFVSRSAFGVLLGVLATAIGVTVVYRQYRGLGSVCSLDATVGRDRLVFAGLGVVLGVASGSLGVGGPVLAVPVLLLVDVPILVAVAVAQVQSVFIATFASLGFLLQGAVSPTLAGLIGLPLVAGVLVGWIVAHRVDPSRLKMALGVVLVVVGPSLVL